MHKPARIPLLLTCALAVSSCASNGGVKQCPKLPPVPASLMVEPQTGQKVRAELLEPQTPPTHKYAPSKTY